MGSLRAYHTYLAQAAKLFRTGLWSYDSKLDFGGSKLGRARERRCHVPLQWTRVGPDSPQAGLASADDA